MNISMRQLQHDMDPCSTNQIISLDNLGKLHRWGGSSYQPGVPQRPEALSFYNLGQRHSNMFQLLWLNTYLLPTIAIYFPPFYDGEREGSPVRLQRAYEIALTTGHRYDGVVLCEVFTEDSRESLLQNISPHQHPHGTPHQHGDHVIPAWVSGPGSGTWKVEAPLGSIVEVDIISSGLLTIIPGPYPIIGHNAEKFNNEGIKTRDADAWSNKGIALAVVETGYNTKLEIYSTHLIYGGDLHDISPEDRIAIQTEQIDQLVSFVQRTHTPANFIVVAGDFNIDASSRYYEQLRYRMEDVLGLEDVWTCYAQSRYGACLGRTDDPATYQPDSSLGCGQFADDGIGSALNQSGRIDYIFVQQPSDLHDITIDISRPRRRPFPRQPSVPEYDKIQYLSDHLGIELTLFFSNQ